MQNEASTTNYIGVCDTRARRELNNRSRLIRGELT
jgi:hypothetical protein